MKSLNGRIKWVESLKLINSSPRSHALPTAANCPICDQGRMQFFNDNVQAGIWCYCKSCHHSDDLMGTLAKKLQMTEPCLVNWLLSNQLIPPNSPISRLLSQRDPLRRRIKSVSGLFDPVERGDASYALGKPRQLLNRLGLKVPRSVSTDWLKKGPGRLFVFADQLKAEAALRPPKDTEPRYTNPRKPVAATLSDYMLVVPFYDCPGRVCSVAMLHADQQGVWQTADWFLRASQQQPVNGGLAMHPDSAKRNDHNELVLTDDLQVYLTLQCSHYLRSKSSIPLACYRSDRQEQTTSWQMLRGKQPIIWSYHLRPQQLWQAIRLDAKVSRVGPSTVPLSEYIERSDPTAVIAAVRKGAVPWPVAVAKLAGEKEPDEVGDWFAQLQLSPSEQDRVLDAATTAQKKVIKNAIKECVVFHSVPFRKGFVEQRADGWYYCKNDGEEQLLTTAPYHVTEVISDGNGDSMLSVTATHAGKEHRFQCLKSKFESDPFGYIEQEMVEAAIALPASDKTYSRQSWHLSLLMHPPKIRRRQSAKNDNGVKTHFIMPSFSISLETGRCFTNAVSDPSVAGSEIESTSWSADLLSDLAGDSHSTPIFACTLALATQLAAKLFCKQSLRIGLPDTSVAGLHSQLIDAIGGRHVNGKRVNTICDEIESHDWFAMAGFSTPLTPGLSQNLLAKPPSGMLSLPVTPGQACHGLLTDSMLLIQHGISTKFPKNQLRNIGSMLCAWVSWVVRSSKATEIVSAPDLVDATTRSLGEYLEQTLEIDSLLLRASRDLRYINSSSSKIAEVTHIILAADDDSPLKDDKTTPLIRFVGVDAMLSIKKFASWLRQHYAPDISSIEFNQLLCGQHANTELISRYGDQYWVFPRSEFKRVKIQQSLAATRARKRLEIA